MIAVFFHMFAVTYLGFSFFVNGLEKCKLEITIIPLCTANDAIELKTMDKCIMI